MGYDENDVVDVDIVVRDDAENQNNSFLFPSGVKPDDSVGENNSVIIPYGEFIQIDNALYVGKKLYYSINGKIVEKDRNRFEIDIHTGKIKNSTSVKCVAEVKPQNMTNYAKFV